MHTVSHRVLLLVALFTSALAQADCREPRRTVPSTLSRLSNASTLKVMPDGTLISLGSSRLQVLRPGAKAWEILLDQKGDHLYRIAFDRSGRVLAAWEKDPLIHLFSADGKQHTTLPKPGIPEEGVYQFRVEHLAFLPNGRDALVFAEGEKLIRPPPQLRVPGRARRQVGARAHLPGRRRGPARHRRHARAVPHSRSARTRCASTSRAIR